jgi:hypothetical protein
MRVGTKLHYEYALFDIRQLRYDACLRSSNPVKIASGILADNAPMRLEAKLASVNTDSVLLEGSRNGGKGAVDEVYLVELLKTAYGPSVMAYQAGKIKDAATLRRVSTQCAKIGQQAQNTKSNPTAIIVTGVGGLCILPA